MRGSGISIKSGAPTGVIGKIFASLFFLLFFGMGSAFVGLMARDAFADIRTWTWTKTNCEIISNSVRDTDAKGKRTGDFYPDVKYRYDFGGLTFTSDRIQRQSASYSDYGRASRFSAKFHAESNAACYVNPSTPSDVVLVRGAPWLLLFIFFPMIFVLIGVAGIYSTWKPKSQALQPISDQAAGSRGKGFMVVFFSIFFLAGSAAFYGIFILPLWHIYSAKHWTEVPCAIISSAVKSHGGNKGNTYSINIFYGYQVNETNLKANRYSFATGSSSGYRSKQAVVNHYPPGLKTVCYVNPNDPLDSVLNRGFVGEMWIGLFPLIFVAVGAGGIIFKIRANRQNTLAAGGTIKSISSTSSQNSVT